MDNIDNRIRGFWILILIIIIAICIVVPNLPRSEDNPIKSIQSQLSLLESRIAKQEEIINHHIKKAKFDSVNQVQAFKKIGE